MQSLLTALIDSSKYNAALLKTVEAALNINCSKTNLAAVSTTATGRTGDRRTGRTRSLKTSSTTAAANKENRSDETSSFPEDMTAFASTILEQVIKTTHGYSQTMTDITTTSNILHSRTATCSSVGSGTDTTLNDNAVSLGSQIQSNPQPIVRKQTSTKTLNIRNTGSGDTERSTVSADQTASIGRHKVIGITSVRRLRTAASTPSLSTMSNIEANHQLASSNSTNNAQQRQFLDTALEIARICISVIDQKATPWHVESLHTAKMACNLTTRFLDCKAYAFHRLGVPKPVKTIASRIRTLKSKTISENPPLSAFGRTISNTGSNSLLRTASTVSKTRGFAASLTNETTDLDQIDAICSWLTSCPFDKNSSALHLQVSMLLIMNSLRWMLGHRPDVGMTQRFLDSLISMSGFMGVYEIFVVLDEKTAKTHYDFIFRILFEFISKLEFPHNIHLTITAIHFYFKSKNFSAKGLHTLIQKPALLANKHYMLEPADLLSNYYHRIASISQFPEKRGFWHTFTSDFLKKGIEVAPDYQDAFYIFELFHEIELAIPLVTFEKSDFNLPEYRFPTCLSEDLKLLRRFQLLLLESIKELRELLDVDSTTLETVSANILTSTNSRVVHSLWFANIAHKVFSTAQLILPKMDGDIQQRMSSNTYNIDARDQILSGSAYQIAALLLRRKCAANALPFLHAAVTHASHMLKSVDNSISNDTKVHLAKRYEVLSFCQQEMGETKAAIVTVCDALKFYPISYARTAGNKFVSPFKQLAARYICLSCKELSSFKPIQALINPSEQADKSTVDFIIQLESQLLQGHGAGHYAKLANIVEAGSYYQKTGNSLAQARTLVDKARIFRNKVQTPASNMQEQELDSLATSNAMSSETDDPVKCCELAVSLLKNLVAQGSEQSKKPEILDEIKHELAIAQCELGISLNSANMFDYRPFYSALAWWKKYFANTHSFTLQSRTFVPKMSERLFQYIDVLKLYREMADTYLALGCTGRAGVMFSLGKQLSQSSKCTVLAKDEFQSRFGKYFSMIGNVEKSQEIFSNISSFASISNNTMQVDEVLQRAQFYLDKSVFLFYKSNVSLAISEATTAYSMIAKTSRRIQTRKSSTSHEPSHIHFSITLNRGSFIQADAYLRQGLEIATQTCSGGYIVELSVCIADLYSRKASATTSLEFIQSALSHASKISNQLPAYVIAEMTMVEADLQRQGGCLHKAIVQYEDASTQLTKASDQKVISRLEDFPVDSTAALSFTNTSNSQSATTPFTPLAKIKVKGKHDNTVLLRCFGLENVKANVICQIADTLIEQSKFEESWNRLMKIDETEHDMFQEAHYYASMALTRFEMFLVSQKGNQRLQMFFDSVYAFPWCIQPVKSIKPTTVCAKSKGSINLTATKRSKMTLQFEKAASQLEGLLQRSLELTQTYGSLKCREDVLFSWTLFQSIQTVLFPGNAVPLDCALSLISHLEQNKAITTQHQCESARQTRRMNTTLELAQPSATLQYDPLDLTARFTGVTIKDTLQPLQAKSRESVPVKSDLLKENLESSIAAFQSVFLANIPENIIVCSFSFDVKRQDLYISRMEYGGAYALFKLPLLRQATRDGETNGLRFEDVNAAFQDIMEESKDTIENSKGRTLSRKEVLEWRKSRAQLDERLQSLLSQIETVWFGGFKGILSSHCLDSTDLEPSIALFKKRLESLVYQAVSKSTVVRTKQLSFGLDLCKTILRMGASSTDDKEIEDVLYYLLDAYQYQGVFVDYDEVTEEIKEVIISFYQDLESCQHRSFESSTDDMHDSPQKHMVLVLDKHSQHLPWESLPALRGHSVSRMPSCAMLGEIYSSTNFCSNVSKEQCFYVLNPSGDLVHTQAEFEQSLSSYFGHGGAEQFVRGQAIQSLDRCAVTLLFGCSSGYMMPAGEFEPQGTPLHYLMAGCPALVANLWDVTDRDIDRYSKSMMEQCGLLSGDSDQECVSLPMAVSLAREDTLLKYLIGAAPVVYGGLPIYINK
ncbi:hypothetical protein BDEG_20308 [Batrachochytrium dendrobatidis JEL423]|uniref:separase n=1 Tax=Batrachochytrium dendrobatidis (strain JEL423) TaxID=403673 RepID=A0A177W8K3_BATDL|nr:hypothetical protein BDEG_20308 [Batrachochytrium dendrobatidis JEL423]